MNCECKPIVSLSQSVGTD